MRIVVRADAQPAFEGAVQGATGDIDLFGEFNRNLAHIESALGVQIMHQGNQLAVFGNVAIDASLPAVEVLAVEDLNESFLGFLLRKAFSRDEHAGNQNDHNERHDTS